MLTMAPPPCYPFRRPKEDPMRVVALMLTIALAACAQQPQPAVPITTAMFPCDGPRAAEWGCAAPARPSRAAQQVAASTAPSRVPESDARAFCQYAGISAGAGNPAFGPSVAGELRARDACLDYWAATGRLPR
jgi:hypothetical protein